MMVALAIVLHFLFAFKASFDAKQLVMISLRGVRACVCVCVCACVWLLLCLLCAIRTADMV